MPQTILYQWENEIGKHLKSLNSWQVANVALFSYGIIKAENCQQVQVCRRLGEYGKLPGLERRFQRFVANEGLKVSQICVEWSQWLWQALGQPARVTIMVDETKLGSHLGIMMVGLAYEKRCIPLIWHCYKVTDYPRCGQVGLIFNLLMHLKRAWGDQVEVLVLADRGIGTSPRLCHLIAEYLNWHYLFRVTGQSKIVTTHGEYTISQQTQPGQIWYAHGKIFKQRGQIPAYAHNIWETGYNEPWALVTNDPALTGFEYACRNWQEQSFRDLKSGGWQWGRSHVWVPAHARRLLILLVLAYGWIIALGSFAFATHQQARLKTFADGRVERRYSIFREGLFYFDRLFFVTQLICPILQFFALPPPD